MPKAAAPKPLSLKMQIAMISITQHGFFNPEFAASFYVDPREQFLTYNLTEAEIESFESYFHGVGKIATDKFGASDKNAKAPSKPKTIPSLKPATMEKLTPVAQEVFSKPAFAAELFAKPAETLEKKSFTETEVAQILAYFSYVAYLVRKNIRSDWP
jgi:ATP-dependent exoDNAse (exonuclease V) alpha subunit